MNILSFFFKKKKPKILCKHKDTKESIVIRDEIWDMIWIMMISKIMQPTSK